MFIVLSAENHQVTCIVFIPTVINTVMDPEASKGSASAVSSSPGVRPSRPHASRDFRTVHCASKRGGGPRPGESIRRAAVTPDDVREGYLVWDGTHGLHLCWKSAGAPQTQVVNCFACSETEKSGSDTQNCSLLHIQRYTLRTLNTTHLHSEACT